VAETGPAGDLQAIEEEIGAVYLGFDEAETASSVLTREAGFLNCCCEDEGG
jgi:hypothetical protein